MIFDAPDRHGGLLERLGFRPTKKNPAHWWRTYNPATDREAAQYARQELLQAGLKGKWSEVEDNKQAYPPRPNGPSKPIDQRGGNWNTGITARPRYNGRGHRRGSGW